MRRTIQMAIAPAIIAILAAVPGQARAQWAPTPSGAVGNGGDRTYLKSEVTNPAVPKPYNASPEYPEPLRSAGVEGVVTVQYTVDTTGRPDMTTFKLLEPANTLFVQAVRNALQRMKFSAAELDGRKVKQLEQQVFMFRLGCVTRPGRPRAICR